MHSKELLWKKCLSEIENLVPPESYATWFSPVYPYSLTKDRMIIAVPNEFYKSCLEENYYEIIKSTLLSLTNTPIQLEFQTEMPPAEKIDQLTISKETGFNQVVESPNHTSSLINTRYNFSNFIVGSSNQFAHAAAMAVANNPTMTYNPLFIYGGVGLWEKPTYYTLSEMLFYKETPIQKCDTFRLRVLQ